MLETILGILGSGSVGSIVGVVGGYMNRKLDIEVHKIDIEDNKAKRENDLLKMDKEKDMMQAKYAMRVQVADKENEGKKIEGDTAVEVAGYGAMEKSYDFAKPTAADGWVDQLSKTIRPLLTILSVVFAAYVFVRVNTLLLSLSVAPDPAQVIKIWVTVIEWVLFQTGVIVGWWFAMRPGKSPKI